jgi:5'-nucleotidase/UDP-sugar diphosphatase
MNEKHITLLHSNDMHGDFLAEARGEAGHLIGGLALLSGYLNQVRETDTNVLYVISGDMVQGSLLDAEFKGISTIEVMNYLAPDVVTLGNHELDYGLPHLLFLEKMANFPIVNANLYIKKYHKRLMRPYVVLDVDGFKFMFIGIITDAVLMSLRSDSLIGTFVSLEEAASEVGRICNAYKNTDIDLTVLLTHIGFESDRELAAILDPSWGVDAIIGGHSHTILEQPAVVNGVVIAQAGTGTDQVGRFDLVVDGDTNRIVDWKWRLIPVNSDLAAPDPELQRFIDSYKEAVDRKYNAILCRFAEKLTHPRREVETSLGNLFADVIAERAGSDATLVGSGSIRCQELGPLVTLGTLREAFPYDDAMLRFTITGGQLKQTFGHIMRPENRTGEGECYQVSRGVEAVYDDGAHALVSLHLDGQPVLDERQYTLTLQGFHFNSSESNLGITNADLTAAAGAQVVATSARDVLEESLQSRQNISSRVEGRLRYE